MIPASVQQLPGFEQSYSTQPSAFEQAALVLSKGLQSFAQKKQHDDDKLMSAFPALVAAGMIQPADVKTPPKSRLKVGGMDFAIGTNPTTLFDTRTKMLDFNQKALDYQQDLGLMPTPVDKKAAMNMALEVTTREMNGPVYMNILKQEQEKSMPPGSAAKWLQDRFGTNLGLIMSGANSSSPDVGSAPTQATPVTQSPIVKFRVGRRLFEMPNDPAVIAEFKRRHKQMGKIEQYAG